MVREVKEKDTICLEKTPLSHRKYKASKALEIAYKCLERENNKPVAKNSPQVLEFWREYRIRWDFVMPIKSQDGNAGGVKHVGVLKEGKAIGPLAGSFFEKMARVS